MSRHPAVSPLGVLCKTPYSPSQRISGLLVSLSGAHGAGTGRPTCRCEGCRLSIQLTVRREALVPPSRPPVSRRRCGFGWCPVPARWHIPRVLSGRAPCDPAALERISDLLAKLGALTTSSSAVPASSTGARGHSSISTRTRRQCSRTSASPATTSYGSGSPRGPSSRHFSHRCVEPWGRRLRSSGDGPCSTDKQGYLRFRPGSNGHAAASRPLGDVPWRSRS